MDKLIELLNERDVGEECWELYYLSNGIIRDDWWNILYDYRTISKQFWFIKWLVENDKIDKKKIDTRLVRNVESHYDEDWYWVENSYEDYSDTDTLLMLLSISNSPIDDLISYLK